MKHKDILLIGAGGHAESCIDVLEAEGIFRIKGIIGTKDEVGKTLLSYPILGTDENLQYWINRIRNVLVTVGQITNAQKRVDLYDIAKKFNGIFPVIVSPNAYVSRSAAIGEGTIIHHGAIINAGTVVGTNCIINSLSLIEHGSKVGNHCHISTGARINGKVVVGDCAFVGSGAIIRENITIGKKAIVGMGAIIKSDVSAQENLMTFRS